SMTTPKSRRPPAGDTLSSWTLAEFTLSSDATASPPTTHSIGMSVLPSGPWTWASTPQGKAQIAHAQSVRRLEAQELMANGKSVNMVVNSGTRKAVIGMNQLYRGTNRQTGSNRLLARRAECQLPGFGHPGANHSGCYRAARLSLRLDILAPSGDTAA